MKTLPADFLNCCNVSLSLTGSFFIDASYINCLDYILLLCGQLDILFDQPFHCKLETPICFAIFLSFHCEFQSIVVFAADITLLVQIDCFVSGIG